MRESRKRRLELWVRGFGNGNRVFTFVIQTLTSGATLDPSRRAGTFMPRLFHSLKRIVSTVMARPAFAASL
jgi:hypothetical protein